MNKQEINRSKVDERFQEFQEDVFDLHSFLVDKVFSAAVAVHLLQAIFELIWEFLKQSCFGFSLSLVFIEEKERVGVKD